MLISDHINFSGASPLIGPNLDAFGPRFPDMSDLYTASLRSAIREKAADAGIPLQEGVYVMYSCPNYETPAEIRMFPSGGTLTRDDGDGLACMEQRIEIVIRTHARDTLDRDEAVCRLLRAGVWCEEHVPNTDCVVRMAAMPRLYRVLANGEEEYGAAYKVTLYTRSKNLVPCEKVIYIKTDGIYRLVQGFPTFRETSVPVTRTVLRLNHDTATTDVLSCKTVIEVEGTYAVGDPTHEWFRSFYRKTGAAAKDIIVLCDGEPDQNGCYTARRQPVCVAVARDGPTLKGELLFDGDPTVGTFNPTTGEFTA